MVDDLEASSAAWFNGLASMQVAAACVLRDDEGRVLLVDPVYKPQWELPGGAVEQFESPLDACRREVAEELSIDVTLHRLLCIDFQTMRHPRRGALRFVFDGGRLDRDLEAAIRVAPGELAGWRFVAVDELDAYLKPTVANRVRCGLASPGCYLENGRALVDR